MGKNTRLHLVFSPTLLSCSTASCVLYNRTENRAQSRLLYLLIMWLVYIPHLSFHDFCSSIITTLIKDLYKKEWLARFMHVVKSNGKGQKWTFCCLSSAVCTDWIYFCSVVILVYSFLFVSLLTSKSLKKTCCSKNIHCHALTIISAPNFYCCHFNDRAVPWVSPFEFVSMQI